MATQVMSPEAPWPTRDERKRHVRLAVLVATVLGLLLVGLLWMLGAEQRAINAMEPGRRVAVFQQSYASF
ncbi:MAG: hypothetical protein ACXU86_16210, partial [Archangium sp.]